MKSKLLTLFLLLAGAARFAGGDDVVAVPAPLPGGDFEADLDAWPLTKEYAIGPWGRNGTNGMKVERQSGYDFMGRPIQLKPGSSYRLGWWLKTDGKLPGGGAAVSVDWYSGGAWVSFTMLDIVADTGGEWRHYSGEFTAPSDPGFTYALLAYLRHDTAGRAWFDDFVLEELVGEAAVYPVNASTGRIVAGTPLDVVVYVTGGGAVPELTYEIVSGGAAAARGTVPVAAERAEIPTAGLLPGDYRLRLTPRQAGRDFAVREYPLTVAAEAVGRVRIDELGRCLVDGEPFMPVGWFISSVAREGRGHGSDCDLSRMAASPFNTVMPYNGLRLPDSTLEDPVAAALEALDACAAANQMVIYSIKDLYPDDRVRDDGRTNEETARGWVEGLKGHPALLAWYVADELSKDKVPDLVRRRQMVNAADPDHPTWAVYCSYADLPFFGPTCDVVGIDPYPFNGMNDRGIQTVFNALADTRRAMLRANGEIALWTVPQAFAPAVYTVKPGTDVQQYLANARVPSVREMASMVLLQAIGGAKGFILYSEFDLVKWPENYRYEERWTAACEVGELLRSVEKFIMSSRPRPPLEVKSTAGRVEARAMAADDGEIAVLIASPLREGGQGEIRGAGLPPGLRSANGNTVETAPGVYRFTGVDADWDILRP